MGNIFRLSKGMQRIDVPSNHIKNNLPIGTILQLNGYDNPRYCVIKNLGITPGFESYGTKYKVINVESGQESIKDALSLDHISKKDKEIRGIHTYFTDTVLSADEIMDLVKKAASKKAADIKAKAAADQARALELEVIERDYKHLERIGATTKAGKRKSSQAIGAGNIRKELALAFPGVKFSVVSDSFSMGDSIDVSWVDDVTTEEVEKIVDKYAYGTFDSMSDCSGEIGTIFIAIFGGARFVQTSRHLSDAAYNAVAKRMGHSQAIYNPRQGEFDGVAYDISEMLKREAWKTKF